MGTVCKQHAGHLSPDYGSCAPLHMPRNAHADTLRAWAGEAERMAAALTEYAAEHRRAAELSDAARAESDPYMKNDHAAASRLAAAAGRAALHPYNVLTTIRDRIAR